MLDDYYLLTNSYLQSIYSKFSLGSILTIASKIWYSFISFYYSFVSFIKLQAFKI